MRTPFDTNGSVTTVDEPAITDRQREYLRALMEKKATITGQDPAAIEPWMDTLNSAQASTKIDEALTWLRDNPAPEIADGFYELTDGRIVKVQHAVHGSGKQYAKVLDIGLGRFDYAPGLIRKIEQYGTLLTLERARELGQLYGMCIRCGATLTDEDSIARGMGPICAGRW